MSGVLKATASLFQDKDNQERMFSLPTQKNIPIEASVVSRFVMATNGATYTVNNIDLSDIPAASDMFLCITSDQPIHIKLQNATSGGVLPTVTSGIPCAANFGMIVGLYKGATVVGLQNMQTTVDANVEVVAYEWS
jgi:hypothetical protein